jgi:hypothetical protein
MTILAITLLVVAMSGQTSAGAAVVVLLVALALILAEPPR